MRPEPLGSLRRILCLVAACLAPLGCAGPDRSVGQDGGADPVRTGRPNSDPSPRGERYRPAPPEAGRLVIVGGALDWANRPIMDAVMEGLEGEGPLCVLPTASGDPEGSMARAVDAFRGFGADSVTGVWVTTENPEAARDPEVVATLGACAGYWFVGGSQSRIIEVFRPEGRRTPADSALHRRWREGAVVAGSSAGAAMMGSRSILGGSSAEALAFGVTADGDADGLWVMDGMGFVDWAMVGQHHLARGRWGRLVVATLEEPGMDLGLGIDENTAVVVDGDRARVAGASGVLLVDASIADLGQTPRTAGDIRLELLGPGDTLEVSTGRVLRAQPTGLWNPEAGWSPEADPHPGLDSLAADPFQRWGLLHLFRSMEDGEAEEVTLDGGARALVVRRTPVPWRLRLELWQP